MYVGDPEMLQLEYSGLAQYKDDLRRITMIWRRTKIWRRKRRT